MRPSQLPCAISGWASAGLRSSASTHRYRAVRRSPGTSASACSSARLFSSSLAAGPAKRADHTPGRPPRASTSSPESSASAGNPAAEACRAFSSALSSKVWPVSAMLTIPNADCSTSSKPRGSSSAANSRCLPGLVVASTTRTALAPLALQCLGLQRAQLADSGDRKIEQRVELVAPEGMALGRALHFNERAAVVHHHVHVGLRLGILAVVQIQHRLAPHDADRYGGPPSLP